MDKIGKTGKCKKKRYLPFNLTFCLTLIVFVVTLITMAIMAALVYFLFSQGHTLTITKPTFFLWICIFSVAIATALTGLLGRFPIAPLRKIIDAINRLGKGDFSVRLYIKATNELAELADSFNHAAEELGSIETLRTDFVNTFSHEFKTPIVSLRGFAKILKNKNLTEEERDEYLDIIISESDRLADLAKNVLTLSKVDNLGILPEGDTFDLTEQVRQTILLCEPKWEKKNINLIVDLEEMEYKGSAELLNHIWLNLLDNAIKFSSEGGTIKVSLKKVNNGVVFSVRDNGPGMTEDVKKHIFNRFYQGDTSHKTAGNGIGLSIVQKVVDIHQGSIQVDSELDFGSTFTVTLGIK